MAAKVGLTGGIGSGKTTVANAFAELGVSVLDADRIARRLSQPGSAPFERIVARFGDGILDSQGRIDRKRLGRRVFACQQQRRQLEAILHPPIREIMTARARRDARPYCILDIPLLVESRQYRDMRRVVVVTCATDTRIRRLMERGMTAADIERVMQNQAGDAERLAVADDVIDNRGGVEDVRRRVRELHRAYTALFA